MKQATRFGVEASDKVWLRRTKKQRNPKNNGIKFAVGWGYFPSPMAANLSFLLNSSGCRFFFRLLGLVVHVLGEVFWSEFLISFHSVMRMQQSAFFRHSTVDEAYAVIFCYTGFLDRLLL